ncbi:MAG: hypothetical protein JKX83_02970 [Pseudomonadales bacterium]|nr:hypothetical protein [Pseudomonadales bacterium]
MAEFTVESENAKKDISSVSPAEDSAENKVENTTDNAESETAAKDAPAEPAEAEAASPDDIDALMEEFSAAEKEGGESGDEDGFEVVGFDEDLSDDPK